mmetsp:Transcript_11703/g.23728  ORF Transcript_11703/g.23728 Transcript_11703/m.23728 type:complete len:230 (-) Transcript_11703:77-766(-)
MRLGPHLVAGSLAPEAPRALHRQDGFVAGLGLHGPALGRGHAGDVAEQHAHLARGFRTAQSLRAGRGQRRRAEEPLRLSLAQHQRPRVEAALARPQLCLSLVVRAIRRTGPPVGRQRRRGRPAAHLETVVARCPAARPAADADAGPQDQLWGRFHAGPATRCNHWAASATVAHAKWLAARRLGDNPWKAELGQGDAPRLLVAPDAPRDALQGPFAGAALPAARCIGRLS